MPNHVYNKMTITKGADLILEALKGKRAFSDEISDITFNALIRMEDDINNPDYQNGVEYHVQSICNNPHFNWYTWSCDHWGTKWDAYNVDIKKRKRSTVITFCTAWTPPFPIYLELIKRFGDKIKFTLKYRVECDRETYIFKYNDKVNDFKE